MKKDTTNDMTVGSPVSLIIKFMIPMCLGNLFQQFYNIADSIVAGKFIGVNALAAIGSTGSLMFFVTGWLNGLSSGFAIIVAQMFGAKKFDRMLSNLTSQLKEQHAEDKFYDVLEEVPRVRKDLGEPPLVTPSSQIVGTQAVFNVLMGERYKMVTKETKDILLGKYGATVKPFNPEVQKKCIGDEKPITCRPADLLDNELEKLESEMAQYKEQDEDVLTYALFPQVAMDFFKYRQAQKTKVDEKAADKKNGAYPV